MINHELLKGYNLMICDEKYNTRYFTCNNLQDFYKTAMFLLKERFENGWYEDEPDDDIAAYYGYIPRCYKPKKDKTLARNIIETNDIEAALEFLYYRSNGKYEEIRFIHTESY